MSGRQSLYTLIVYGGIVLTTVVGAIILGWEGTLDAPSITAIFGTAVGFAGGSAASQSSLNTAVNGKSVVSSQAMTEREATLRQAIATGQNPPVQASHE